MKRAQKKKLIDIQTHDIRSATTDRHRTADDTPYGGGPGMVLKIDVVHRALKKTYPRKNKSTRVILLSARGTTYTQNDAKRLRKYKRLILIAGHYEEIDARIERYVDESVSIGNYILTGGELAAAVIVDSVSRLVPGVLGKEASTIDESHSAMSRTSTTIEYPQYTRPEIYDGHSVPKVLLTGNHQDIKKWREMQAKKRDL